MSLNHISFFISANVGLYLGSFAIAFITYFGNYGWIIFFFSILRKVYLTFWERKG
jgi:hypothetical protein